MYLQCLILFLFYAFKFHSVSMTWTRVSRPPFSRHQILARPVGPISPLIFEFQHRIATYEFLKYMKYINIVYGKYTQRKLI